MFEYFGIAHDEIGALTRTNANPVPTRITEADVAEFYQVLEMLPPALLERIEFLKGFDPRPSDE